MTDPSSNTDTTPEPKKPYRIVSSPSTLHRFAVAEPNGVVVDDAQGRGYSSEAKAEHAAKSIYRRQLKKWKNH